MTTPQKPEVKDTIRERDTLWLKALICVGDIDLILRNVKKFNELRELQPAIDSAQRGEEKAGNRCEDCHGNHDTGECKDAEARGFRAGIEAAADIVLRETINLGWQDRMLQKIRSLTPKDKTGA